MLSEARLARALWAHGLQGRAAQHWAQQVLEPRYVFIKHLSSPNLYDHRYARILACTCRPEGFCFRACHYASDLTRYRVYRFRLKPTMAVLQGLAQRGVQLSPKGFELGVECLSSNYLESFEVSEVVKDFTGDIVPLWWKPAKLPY